MFLAPLALSALLVALGMNPTDYKIVTKEEEK